jgi:hypothetical protein
MMLLSTCTLRPRLVSSGLVALRVKDKHRDYSGGIFNTTQTIEEGFRLRNNDLTWILKIH